MAKYILEHKLGYRVDTVQVDEQPAWDALSQGRVDAILEDWGHPEEEQRYVKDKKTVTARRRQRRHRPHRLVRPQVLGRQAP